MAVLAPAEFTAVVAEHGGDLGVVGLEEGQHVIVEHVNGRDRQLICVETPPGIAAEAVDDGPQVHLADAFESTHEECVYGHQITGVTHLDMAFTELGAETFQKTDLFVTEFDFLLPGRAFQAQQAVMFGEQVMTAPDPANASGADLYALQGELLRDPDGTMRGVFQAVIQDSGFDLFADPVGMRAFGAG